MTGRTPCVGGGVQRIEVTEREKSVFGGMEFGTVGTYERLHGTVFGELDPTHPLNAGIVNLGRATRNTRGNVEYQSDFRIFSSVSGSPRPPRGPASGREIHQLDLAITRENHAAHRFLHFSRHEWKNRPNFFRPEMAPYCGLADGSAPPSSGCWIFH
jgi:hypothetical protein